MGKTTKKTSKSIKETNEIAKIFLDKILTPVKREGALVVCLSGDLGAGKTAFTKAVAKHLGIKHTVNSPTFVIIKKYPLKNIQHKFLWHIDAYRLESVEELLRLGWQDIVYNKENIVFIEWPENVAKIIPANANHIYISSNKNGHRNLELK